MDFSKRRRGSRSSENNDSAKKDQELKFQMNGQKVTKTATYTKVLERIVLKIQSTITGHKNILKSIKENQKFVPARPKWTRIKLEGTDGEQIDQVFRQQTEDIAFRDTIYVGGQLRTKDLKKIGQ